MNQDGLLRRKQEVLSVGNAAAGLQQLLRLIRNLNVYTVIVGGQILPDLGGEVVHIDHQMVITCCAQFHYHVMQQRLSTHGHQGLGHGIGDGLQAGSQTSRKDHRLHN